LLFSGPADRHYTIERSRARVQFGDDEHGRIPVAGPDNLRARRYRSGGGSAGNLPAGAIARVQSGALVQGVRNVLAAAGGAEGEGIDRVIERGPRTMRNRGQAVALEDYGALAHEASPAVAVARALSRDPHGRSVPGWVTVVVVPYSDDPRPQPSAELRREVREFLLARAPAALGGRLTVTGPRYAGAGIDAAVAPVRLDESGPVGRAVEEAARAFLHPVAGFRGRGWAFGADVYASDVATLLEGVPGVDHVEALTLLADGVPAGDRIAVDDDRIVVAGPVRIRLVGGGA
jgi:predicted phage baseplate assembly protein